ncbi:helix-turn-helix domain-containing protein [Streptomyces sp. NPDC051784]|uniref:PucR family transcriptional regulator n=1 Tax=Streptomyces sp. NPDC051784 TaxID=3155805 RepID=UPI00344AA7BD
MNTHATSPEEIQRRAEALVVAVATEMSGQLDGLVGAMQTLFSDEITELRGDPALREILAASNSANLEAFTDVVRYGIDTRVLTAPAAAEEYARRLARRAVASSALIRAYRFGQQLVLRWFMTRISEREPDARVAYAAGQQAMELAFSYVDTVSEQVVAVYEAERERWLANRSTERAAVLKALLGGEVTSPATAERSLGYRLTRRHLGVIMWTEGRRAEGDLHRFETLLTSLTTHVDVQQAPLFVPQDRSVAWAWVPLRANDPAPAPEQLTQLAARAGTDIRLACGTPATGVSGFRTTHVQALRAQTVAMIAGDRADPATSFGDADVRIAALLAADLEATRNLVAASLGALGEDNETTARLRETLLAFLGENGSYVATARRVHLHKNTVKYRVDKAVQARGRAVGEDRLELELALVAGRRLGGAVLRTTPGCPGAR